MSSNTKTAKNFTMTDIGSFGQILGDEPNQERVKNFFKELLGLTGMEVSITAFSPGSENPFFHSHKQNEELYVVLSGQGRMQLDEDVIELKEGSFVRVSPACARRIKANADSKLIYLCIQVKDGSLEQSTKEDGVKEERQLLL